MHIRKPPEARERINWKDQQKQTPQLTQDQKECLFLPFPVENSIINMALSRINRSGFASVMGQNQPQAKCCSGPPKQGLKAKPKRIKLCPSNISTLQQVHQHKSKNIQYPTRQNSQFLASSKNVQGMQRRRTISSKMRRKINQSKLTKKTQ